MAVVSTLAKERFTPFVRFFRSEIIPLLGDEKVADLLEEGFSDADIHPYEKLIESPAGVRAHLKPHQLEGVSFLNWLRKNDAHGILGDDMGLGKTLQVLSFFQLIRNTEEDENQPFLVVCPLTVLDSWIAEVEKWTTLRAVQYHGNIEKRQMISKLVKNGEADIVLVTYETVVSDMNRVSRMAHWKCVVCDEGHRLKNSTKQLSTSIRKLKTEQRLILTGTPIQNDLCETWSLFNWLYPDVFVDETESHFREAFCLGDGKVDPVFLDHVKRFLRIIMMRRIKESMMADLHLHQKREVILYLPLTGIQKRLYIEILTGGDDQQDSKVDQNDSQMLVTPPQSPGFGNYSSHTSTQPVAKRQSLTNILMELRKVCLHSFFLVGSEHVDEDPDINVTNLVHGSSKFIVLKRLIEEEVIKNQKKILVFSGFNYALDCCESLLAIMGITSLRLDGETSYALRKYNIHRFQNQSQYKVFVMATRAGGEGITLTAAEVVVFLDSDWNPQVTAQAEARAYRIGQTKPVTVYKLCTQGTVEEQMLNRVNKKLYLASKMIENFANTNFAATQSDTIDPDSDFIQKLIRDGQKAVKMTTLDAVDMLIMDWKSILNLCRKTADGDEDVGSPPSPPASPQSTSFNDDERLWLARHERVQTALFDGKLLSRPRAERKPELLTDLDLYNRRLNKNRVIYDKEVNYYVNKESTLCKFGEAVPTLTGDGLKTVKKAPKVEFRHLKTCMVCHRTRNLEECLYCPQVYHKRCVVRHKEAPKNNPFNNSICLKHRCFKCSLTATSSGGVLFSCITCPHSYCIECIDLNAIESIQGELPAYKDLGYQCPKHIEYIKCEICVKKARDGEKKRVKAPTDARILRSLKRARRFAFE